MKALKEKRKPTNINSAYALRLCTKIAESEGGGRGGGKHAATEVTELPVHCLLFPRLTLSLSLSLIKGEGHQEVNAMI